MSFSAEKNLFQRIYASLTRQAQTDISKIANGQLSLTLPIITRAEIEVLCTCVLKLFKSEPTLLRIEPPLVVVGDLHGHFLDLLRIIQKNGLPLTKKFLFLGDLVDRGEFSIETVTLVFALKAMYPSNVFIIRGNHEFDFLCKKCGFQQEVISMYNDVDVYDTFVEVFKYMPLCALIKEKIFCVHGGIGPMFEKLSQVEEIKRPVDDFGDSLLDTMLWSDPNEKIDQFELSVRGTGYFYGEKAFTKFLDDNKLSLFIRAHECVMDGACSCFNDRLITVFGASNYCGLVQNCSATVSIDKDLRISVDRMQPLAYVKRCEAIFTKPEKPQKRKSADTSCFGSAVVLPHYPSSLGGPRPIQPKSATIKPHGTLLRETPQQKKSSLKIGLERRTHSMLLFQ